MTADRGIVPETGPNRCGEPRSSSHRASAARRSRRGTNARGCFVPGEKSQHRPFNPFDKSAVSSDADLRTARKITGRRSCSAATASIEEASWSWSPIALSSCDDERAVDLSTGEEIVLLASTAGGPCEQTRWALRCDRWSQLYHPAIARLVDYGIVGEMRRFEAWRGGPPWQGSRAAREQATRSGRCISARKRTHGRHLVGARGRKPGRSRDRGAARRCRVRRGAGIAV